LEKEARLVLKELWAKVSPSEKFVAYGAAAVVVGWILGQILGSSTIGGGSVGGYNIPGVTINYFGWGNAGLLELVALLAAIVVGVVLYLKVAPNMNITWPLPVVQILLGAAVVSLVCGVLATLIQITNGGNPPILMYVADVLVIGGGAAMAWFTYQEFVTSKAA
jgi:hypothetical protein